MEFWGGEIKSSRNINSRLIYKTLIFSNNITECYVEQGMTYELSGKQMKIAYSEEDDFPVIVIRLGDFGLRNRLGDCAKADDCHIKACLGASGDGIRF